MKQVYTTGEVSKFCHVSYKTVLNWIHKGHINAFRLPGGDHRISHADLVTFMKAQQLPFPPELIEESGKKIKVMICDDEESMRTAFARAFRDSHFETLLCKDGFEAGIQLMTSKPDYLLLDLTMPGINGVDVARQIKSKVETQNIQIIIVSARITQESRSALEAIGVTRFEDKPVNFAELREMILEESGL